MFMAITRQVLRTKKEKKENRDPENSIRLQKGGRRDKPVKRKCCS